MLNPMPNVVPGDGGNRLSESVEEVGYRAGFEGPPAGFDLRPPECNRIPSRRIGWQKQPPGPRSCNGVLNVIEFMDRVVIPHHTGPAVERGHEERFNKEQPRLPSDRAGDTQARAQALQAQRAAGRHGAAMISRDLLAAPLARGGTTVHAGQAEMATQLVNKDEVLTRQTLRKVTKLLAGLFVPLAGDQTFFSAAAVGRVSHGRSWTDERSCDSAP